MRSLVALLLLVWQLPACGSTCGRIVDNREAFLEREPTKDRRPDGYVDLPFALVDRQLKKALRTVKPVAVKVPGLKNIRIAPTSATLAQARPGRLGFALEFAVRRGKKTLFTLATTAETRPELDADAQAMRFSIGPESLRKVKPKLGPGAKEAVTAAIRKQLPGAMRKLVSKKRLGKMVDKALGSFVNKGYGLLRDGVLAKMAPATEFTLALPEIPLRDLAVRTRKGGWLEVGLHAALPTDGGLKAARAGPPKDQIRVRFAGSAIAELGNYAMAEGHIPSRFTGKGKPKSDGPIAVGLGWSDGDKPLKVFAWQSKDACLRARLGGTPELGVATGKSGRTLSVAVKDGAVEDIDGSWLIEIGAWMTGVWDKSIKFSHEVAAGTSMKVAGRKVAVQMADAKLDERALTVMLDVTVR